MNTTGCFYYNKRKLLFRLSPVLCSTIQQFSRVTGHVGRQNYRLLIRHDGIIFVSMI